MQCKYNVKVYVNVLLLCCAEIALSGQVKHLELCICPSNLHKHSTRSARTLGCQMLYIIGCIASVWELHADTFYGNKSQAYTLVTSAQAELNASSAAPMCLSYCDVLFAVTQKPPSRAHFCPHITPCKVPATWKERQINVMVVESYSKSEGEESERDNECTLICCEMLMLSGL